MLKSFELNVLCRYSSASTAKSYQHNLLDDRSVIDWNQCHTAVKFGVFVREHHDKLAALYWLKTIYTRLCF